MTTEDGEQIREALERLKNSSMEIGKSIYSNTSSDSGNQEESAQDAQQESTESTNNEEGEKKEEDKEKKWTVENIGNFQRVEHC